jgi:UPF0755 protein
MNLESCATVLYALGKKKKLYESDLLIDSKYNTYRHKGLPPTPICNPGEDSIIAAVEPANTNYFYFVSKGDGSHLFAQTYKEHIRNKNYIKNLRK